MSAGRNLAHEPDSKQEVARDCAPDKIDVDQVSDTLLAVLGVQNFHNLRRHAGEDYYFGSHKDASTFYESIGNSLAASFDYRPTL